MSWQGESPSGVMVFTSDGLPTGVAFGSDSQHLMMRGDIPVFINPVSPKTTYTTGTPNVNIGTSETALASGTITPIYSTSNIAIFVRMDLKKDALNPARIVSTNVRTGNQISGTQVAGLCVAKSQTGGGVQFGPIVHFGRHTPGATSQQVYTVWGTVDAVASTGVRYEILLEEVF
jgi:hypothetical protein